MTAQVTCFKCGVSNVNVTSTLMDRKSDSEISVPRNLVVGGLITVMFGFLLVMMLLGAGLQLAEGNNEIIWTVIFGLALFAPLVTLGTRLLSSYIWGDRVELNHYQCITCGYSWERWQDGWSTRYCTRCGKQMVNQRTTRLDPRNGKPIVWWKHNLLGSLSTSAGAALMILSLFLWLNSALLEGLFPKLITASLGLSLFSWGLSGLIYYFGDSKARLDRFQCAACGHDWERVEGVIEKKEDAKQGESVGNQARNPPANPTQGG